MKSHLRCHFLLLVVLISRGVVLVKASNKPISCGNDTNCQALAKLMEAVNEINNKLEEPSSCPDVHVKLDKLAETVHEMHGKQVKDAEKLNVKLVAISAQLEKHAADLLQHDERLKANGVCPDVNENLDKLAATVHELHGKQVKDVEKFNVKLDRCLATTGDIVTLLEKHSADLLQHDERLKANDVCPDVNENLEKLATNVRDMHSKQVKDAEELKVNMNRSLSSTAAISTQLEKHSADLLSHDERLKAHDVSQNSIYELVKSRPIQSPQPKPRDCSDIRDRGNSVSGVYRVDLGNENRKIEMDVYCDFKTVGQSWLIFQRRKDGSVSFDRNWNDYTNGFGHLTGEFWLGNEKLSLLTMNKKYKLRIELEDFAGAKGWAEFSTFSVKPSTDKYRLTVAGYSGNAGDSLTYSSNMMFSTKDADNDVYGSNCAQMYTGGWWFKSCMNCNLNGLYLGSTHTQHGKGVYWYPWRGAYNSLKVSEMKISAV